MPHAVISGAPPLDQFWHGFEPYQQVNGSEVRNLLAAYLRSDATQLLVLALAIELGVTQRFLIVVEQKTYGLTKKKCYGVSPVTMDNFLSASEAKEFGLVDEVVSSRKDVTTLPEKSSVNEK